MMTSSSLILLKCHSNMYQLFKHLFLQLRFQLTLFHFVDLGYCPVNQFLDFGPPKVHSLRVENHNYELVVVSLDRCS